MQKGLKGRIPAWMDGEGVDEGGQTCRLGRERGCGVGGSRGVAGWNRLPGWGEAGQRRLRRVSILPARLLMPPTGKPGSGDDGALQGMGSDVSMAFAPHGRLCGFSNDLHVPPGSNGVLTAAQADLWMGRLLRRAEAVGRRGEVPVAAVVLDGGGRALGWGSNRRHHNQDPLGHAELVALRQAAASRGDWRFNDCSLLVTLEPCPMCAGALLQARMGAVLYAAPDPKRGALGGCLNLAADPSAHHHLHVVGGVREAEARAQLEGWFRRRRRRKAHGGEPAGAG